MSRYAPSSSYGQGLLRFARLSSYLQYNPDLTLHEANWKRLLLTALMIAQKTWDDRALMNRDFPAVSGRNP